MSTHWPRPVHSVHSLDPLMPCHSLRPQAGHLGTFIPLWRRRMPASGWTHRLSWSPPPATPSEVRVCGSSCPGDLKTLSRAKDCRMGPREADLISGASQGPPPVVAAPSSASALSLPRGKLWPCGPRPKGALGSHLRGSAPVPRPRPRAPSSAGRSLRLGSSCGRGVEGAWAPRQRGRGLS